MSVKETINNIFAKLPFRALAEKIPESAQAKAPVLKKAIPFANQIVCGLVVVIIVVAVACSGGGVGGGKPNPASDFSYDLTEDGTGIVIKGYTGGPGKVVIPAKIEDLPVLEIGDKAFDGESLNFGTFMRTDNLLDIEGVDNEKAGITAIVMPDTVRKIGIRAFANTAITSIVIPDSVTELAYHDIWGSTLFNGCDQLTEIHFSDNIEILPNPLFGFGGAPALKKVNLPKNLKLIAGFEGGGAFGGCGELSELIIPETLTSVEFAERNYFKTNTDGSEEWKWFKEGEKINSEDTQGVIEAFMGCAKLPLKTRQQLKDMGYTGSF